MRYAGVALSLLFLSLYSVPVAAMQITAPHMAKKPVIDGKVSTEEMAGCAKVSMILVGGLDKPKHPTDAFLYLNDDGLYIGFSCDEPAMAGIIQRATTENGAVFSDDSVQLFIAPNREATKTNYYHFAVSAGGVKYSNGMESDTPVAVWQAAASKGDKSWQAEMFIPYAALGGENDVPYWRLNLARERPARPGENGETSAWINPGASLHNYKRFGFLQFARPAVTVASAAAPATSASIEMPAVGTNVTIGATTSTITSVQTVSAMPAPVATAIVPPVATPSPAAVQTTTAIFAAPQ